MTATAPRPRAAPGVIIGERCHYCSKFRSPLEIRLLAGGAKICQRCYHRHELAVAQLSGNLPPGCQGEQCNKTFDELEPDPGTGNIRLYVHMKDGIYQLLCKACSDRYFPKRADLYGDTLFGWRQLVAAGMPFVKLLLLRGQFEQVDITGWQDVLAEAGFDVALAEAVVLAAQEEGPVDDGGRLLARRLPAGHRAEVPLRVSFFGPWNYDNGLGAASRGIIAAIRRTGALLSLHPIKRPFHIHKPLAPPVDIVDFEGPADIAVIHLNPDSWHLLTDDQHAAIAAAGRRIGYWVWEMGHIPPAWRRNFGAVDRIWAPSRYCAEVFTANGDVPVDVVPHVVPVPEPLVIDRAAALARWGLPADRRTILYVFDGASYLVRKNPGALVRALA